MIKGCYYIVYVRTFSYISVDYFDILHDMLVYMRNKR